MKFKTSLIQRKDEIKGKVDIVPLFTEESLAAAQQRTAEACAKVCDKRRRTVSNGNGISMWSHDPASVEAGYCADAIRNNWREYL